MRFAFDPAKAAANIKKHGISFADAEGALLDPFAITIEDPDVAGEHRLITIGCSLARELVVVVYVESNDEYRLISARRATKTERKLYEG